jgi:hypothetical protein
VKPIVPAVLLAASLATTVARSEYQLPVYTYSIRSGDYTETDILRQSFDRVVTGTVWLCSVSVITSGLVARCRTPGDAARVAIKASCVGFVRIDEQTVHLSDLSGGFASITIGCNRLSEDEDDGF